MISPFHLERPHYRRRFHTIGLLLSAVVAVAVAGCREEELIEVYEVPEVPDRGIRKVSAGGPARMFAALVRAGGSDWTFKIVGPTVFVDSHKPAFLRFVENFRIENGAPKFDVPEGWREEDGGMMRFKTFVIDNRTLPRVELVVTQMPEGQDLPANVQRWRGQLLMPKVDDDEALADLQTLKSEAGPALWIDLEGIYSPKALAAPFAGGAMAAADGMRADGLPPDHPPTPRINPQASPVVSRTAPVGSPVKYEAPEAWTPVPPPQFAMAGFEVADGDQALRISISNVKGDLLSNVNRWRGQQLGLPTIEASQLDTQLTKMTIGDKPGDYVEFAGTFQGRPTTIAVGIVPASDGGSWFIKLMGDTPLAERERANFNRFLATFKFER